TFPMLGDHQPVALLRLGAARGEIDDCQPCVNECASLVGPDAFSIRAAAAQASPRPARASCRGVIETAKINQSGNAAHKRLLSSRGKPALIPCATPASRSRFLRTNCRRSVVEAAAEHSYSRSTAPRAPAQDHQYICQRGQKTEKSGLPILSPIW